MTAPEPLVERLAGYARIARDYEKDGVNREVPPVTFGHLAALLEEAAQALGNVATWRGDPERMQERERRIATEEAERNAQDAFEYNCPYDCQDCAGRSSEHCAHCTNCGHHWAVANFT